LEEEKIKSALELAMERVSRLPELTPEEIAEQKERELRPIGRTISSKYLQDWIDENGLLAELHNYQGEQKSIVRRALVSSLCQSIQLEDISKSEKAFQGLASLEKDVTEFWEEIQKTFLQIRRDFEREKQIFYKKYESIAKVKLQNAGIRGSAVKPNLIENEDWLRNMNGVCRTYEPKLKEIKDKLTNRLGAQC
jgi:hypothetical protein